MNWGAGIATWNGPAAAWLGTLGSLSVAAGLVFLAVLLLLRVVPTRHPNLRYALLLLVLLRFVVPPSISSTVGLRPSFGERPLPAQQSTVGDSASSVGAASKTAFLETSPGVHVVPEAADLSFLLSALALSSRHGALLLASVWALGASATGIWLFVRRRRFRRVIAQSQRLQRGDAYEVAERWRASLGIRRSVRILLSAAPVVPFTMGVLRPVVVLPGAVAESGDAHVVEAVVAHELAHVKRLDDAVLVLQCLVQSVFFFHPAAWLVASLLSHERELACDRRVLESAKIQPRRYGRALLDVTALDLKTNAAVAAAGTHRRLTLRMHQIASSGPVRRLHPALVLVLAALCAGLLLPLSATGKVSKSDASGQPIADPLAGVVGLPKALAIPGVNRRGVVAPTLQDVLPGARVTSRFGSRLHPVEGAPEHHGGVDLSTGAESAVFAPRGGVVEVAQENYGENGRMGTVVIIDHGNGLKTFYAHLSRAVVREGDVLDDRYRTLGFAGDTGLSTGAHVHFEIWKDGERQDPANIATLFDGC